MINQISGSLKEKNPSSVYIEIQGVILEIRIPISTYEKLPDKGKVCSLYTYLYLSFSQDEIRLYGFATLAERAIFIRLIAISGIGPKIALSIISSMNPNMLIKAIYNQEDALLSKVPGIGKKTAQRIIVELKDEIIQYSNLLEESERTPADNITFEVEQALVALGYNAKEIQKAHHKLSEEEMQMPIEQQIKKVIKILYQK